MSPNRHYYESDPARLTYFERMEIDAEQENERHRQRKKQKRELAAF